MRMRCRRKLAAHGLGIGIDTGLFKMEPAISAPYPVLLLGPCVHCLGLKPPTRGAH